MARNRRNTKDIPDWEYDEWETNNSNDRKREKTKSKPRRGNRKSSWFDDINISDPDYGFRDDFE